MENIEREDIYIISRNSNLKQKDAESALATHVYNQKQDWQKFLKYAFIAFGIGFTVVGLLFFFAYNWADLPKSVKLGLTQLLIIASTLAVLFLKTNNNIRNIVLTGSAIFVGVLFAIYGQIYQTGANAYDFFLAWTIFITLWVLVSNFAPLWLIYILLINTTFVLFIDQVGPDWSAILIFFLLFIMNASFLVGAILLSKYQKIEKAPNWFLYVIALATITISTAGVIYSIIDKMELLSYLFVLTAIVFYVAGIYYGLKQKNAFYLSIIQLSIIIIICALILNGVDSSSSILLIGIFLTASITGVIKNLMNLQKKWNNEK
ncbi:MAG: DUF2157 domain-containing protein [Pelobium sp.]